MREGITPDISAYIAFEFWEKVYYLDPEIKEGKFPNLNEKLGRWCGVAENYGDGISFWIFTEDTNKLIVKG